jgi:hypothetical protein
MKTEIKFNHNADTLTEALGMKQSAEEVSMSITDVVKDWTRDESKSSSMSHLAESIHSVLPYETILLLATREVHETLEKAFSDDPIRKLLSLLESIDEQSMDEETERKVRDN